MLLFLLVYNMLGYYVVFVFRQAAVKAEMANKLTLGKVETADLIVIKIPVPLYHQTDRRGFEEVRGQFEYKDKFYEMVRQKLEDDTLYVYCLNNEKKSGLFAELSQHTRSHVMDLSGNPPGPLEKFLKTFIKEYLPVADLNACLFRLSGKQEFARFNQVSLPSFIQEIPAPPPELS